MSTSQQWEIVAGRDEYHGPFTAKQIREFAKNGTIRPETKLFLNRSRMVAANEIKGLEFGVADEVVLEDGGTEDTNDGRHGTPSPPVTPDPYTFIGNLAIAIFPGIGVAQFFQGRMMAGIIFAVASAIGIMAVAFDPVIGFLPFLVAYGASIADAMKYVKTGHAISPALDKLDGCDGVPKRLDNDAVRTITIGVATIAATVLIVGLIAALGGV